MTSLIILVIIGAIVFFKLYFLKDEKSIDLPSKLILIGDKPIFIDRGFGRCLGGTYDHGCENAATMDYNGHNYFVCDYHYVLNDFELLENEIAYTSSV